MENCTWCIWKISRKVERLNFVFFSKFLQCCFIKVNEVGEFGLPVLGSYTSLLCSFCESSFGQIKSDKIFSRALVLHILIDAVFFQKVGLIEMHFYLPGNNSQQPKTTHFVHILLPNQRIGLILSSKVFLSKNSDYFCPVVFAQTWVLMIVSIWEAAGIDCVVLKCFFSRELANWGVCGIICLFLICP